MSKRKTKKNLTISPSEIVKKNERLIFSQAHKFRTTTVADFEDYTQTGALALVRCINRYKPEKKTKITTYAYSAIFREIRNTQVNKFRPKVSLEDLPEDLVEENIGERLIDVLPSNLTDLERQCVELLAVKYKLRDIARKLKIKVKEVNQYLQSAIEKVRVANA